MKPFENFDSAKRELKVAIGEVFLAWGSIEQMLHHCIDRLEWLSPPKKPKRERRMKELLDYFVKCHESHFGMCERHMSKVLEIRDEILAVKEFRDTLGHGTSMVIEVPDGNVQMARYMGSVYDEKSFGRKRVFEYSLTFIRALSRSANELPNALFFTCAIVVDLHDLRKAGAI